MGLLLFGGLKMSYFKGKDIVVTFDSGVQAASTNVTVSMSADNVDVSNADSNSFQEVISGLKSMTVSVDGLATDANTASILSNLGSIASLSIALSSYATISCQAHCNSIEVSGESEGATTYSAEFTSTGDITNS